MKGISKIRAAIRLIGLHFFKWFSEFFKDLQKRSKKIAALLLVLFTLVPNVQSFALSIGNSATIERTWVSGVEYNTGNWTDASGNTHYSHYGQFAIYKVKATGEPLYCLQPDISVNLSATATAKDFTQTDAWRNISTSAQKIVTQASIYGYPNYTYGYSAEEAQTATAMILWDAAMGKRTDYSHGIKSWVTSCPSDIVNCYNRILDAMSSHSTTPSIRNTTVTLKGTGESNAVTLTDTNGILSNFNISSGNSNIKFSQSGNNLKIWCTANGNYSGAITLTKKNTDIGSALALTGADQTMLYGSISDPVQARVNVNVQSMKCNVSVAKQDSESNAILDGAAFKVQQWSYSQNKYVDYKTLSATEYNGSRRYTATDLEQTSDNGGWFKIVETGAPTGYELNPTFIPAGSYTSTSPGEFRLTDDMSGKTFNFTVKDPPWQSNASIVKLDSNTDIVLVDAEFKMQEWSHQSQSYHDYKDFTYSNGKYTVSELYFTPDNRGWFKIVETGSPAGYELNPTFIPAESYNSTAPGEFQITEVMNGKTFSFTVKDPPQLGTLEIVKEVEDGFKEGHKFHLFGTSRSGVYVDEYSVTDKNSRAVFKDILVGDNYTIEEVETGIQYIVPPSQTAAINWNEVTELYFENVLKRGNVDVVKTSEDGVVEGFKLHLFGTADSGAYVDEYAITDKNGIAHFKNILTGSNFTCEEIEVPDYYIQPEAQTGVKIEWDKTTNISFYNELKRSDLNVIKDSEDGLKEGNKFHLFGTSLSGIPVDEYAVTDKNGMAVFKNILIGYGYTVEEVETGIQYVIPPNQSAAIEWNKVTTVHFVNTLKKFKVEFTKTDSEKIKPQGDATLAGAVYGIYKGETLIDTYTTDAYGKFTTKYYICGDDWTFREISPSPGYLLDETVYRVDAEAELYTVEYNITSVTTIEDVIKGSIAIIKHTDNGSTQIERPEVGAEFEVYLKSAGSYMWADEDERDILVCDEYGYDQSKLLPSGVYTVHQTKGWDGRELMPDFDVFISENGKVYRFLINNSYLESYLKIVKTVADSKKPVLYAGAGFQIYDPNGELVSMQVTYPTPMVIDTFYTNSEGYLVTPEKLEYGKGYKLVEVQAPYGCILDSTPIEFDITEETAVFEDALAIVTVERPNELQMGTIEINKSGAVFSSVSQSGDVYTPIFENAALANTVFEIYAAENIVTPDGVLRLKKGRLADTVTTDENGRAVSKKLYLGKYIVKEKQSIFSFILNKNEYLVELKYQGQNVEVTSTAVFIYNDRQRVSVSLEKALEKDKLFALGMNDEIKSVRFGLFSNEDIAAADGSVIPKNSLISSAYCDENGMITFDCDLPIGFKWYVREMSVDEHYIISDTKYEFETEYQGQDTESYIIEINNGKGIVNQLKRGTVIGYKVNRETGNPIKRALFGLFKYTETEFTKENALMIDRTDKKGIFTFENLPKGQYLIKELQPAKGYLPNDEVYAVTVNENEEIVEITVVNDLIPEIGTTAAINGEKDAFSAEKFVIDDTVEYKHLIPGKEYTVKGVLMNKATGEPFVVNGEEICSEATFTPEEPSGSVTVSFEFDSSVITEKTDLVVFEELYKDGVQLTVHADLEDENQTVTIHTPEIGTTAMVNGEKEVFATEVFTLEDVVSYTDLIPGKEYIVKGVLMDKVTGTPFIVNDEEVYSEVIFTPEEANGSVTVYFEFDSKYIKEETEVVAFETLYFNDIELAMHTDINDEGQTVAIKIPEIGTSATINGEKEITTTEIITVVDTVTYRNLTAGKEYIIKGILMDKKTGKPFLIDAKEIQVEAAFTPEEPNGQIEIPFNFNGTSITEDTDIVVFETLYRDGVEIAVHTDLEDEEQTVTVHPQLEVPDTPDTGDSNLTKAVIIGTVISGAALLFFIYFYLKRKHCEEKD